ncbi:anti-sigma factor RsiW [Chromobacterium alkanivorans]|uniref:anti-sigma factor family protein n=1 Tax=Chromobacterium alkanivorans TaxID=1071719 RepID=UPI0021689BD4|nr:anti-sigma factor [Chromobacterium alkanivorans]MCS3806874.1 anti-sigma factor RsiW [Chromobacterium alkanivorans]MCS3876210.1 anti-sigma factor RsiW [Chromobacterium alkanivorans]
MMETVTEQELQAYLDDALPLERRAAVEAYLENHPEARERLRTYRRLQDDIGALFEPALLEPVPPRLLAAALPPPQRGWRVQWWQGAAASLLMLVLGGGGGWLLRGQLQAPAAQWVAAADSQEPLPRLAAMAHVVYSPDVKRPVEIDAEHQDQLVAWLSKRLQSRVKPPLLSAQGYELIGGRLLPGEQGPVAQFMYHNAAGQRMTLYVATTATPRRDAGFRFASQGPVNVFYWWDGRFAYALSAGLGQAELGRLAEAAQRQLRAS